MESKRQLFTRGYKHADGTRVWCSSCKFNTDLVPVPRDRPCYKCYHTVVVLPEEKKIVRVEGKPTEYIKK